MHRHTLSHVFNGIAMGQIISHHTEQIQLLNVLLNAQDSIERIYNSSVVHWPVLCIRLRQYRTDITAAWFTGLFCAFASCLLSAYSAHTRCESTNSLSHGRTYLHNRQCTPNVELKRETRQMQITEFNAEFRTRNY